MGSLSANDAMIGLTQRCKRERVRSGSVKDEKYFTRRVENFTNQIRRLLGIEIIAISSCVTLIGFRQ